MEQVCDLYHHQQFTIDNSKLDSTEILKEVNK